MDPTPPSKMSGERVHALEMGAGSGERVAPSLALEQKRRIRIAMISISAIAVALACTVLVLESSSPAAAPVTASEHWLEAGRASLSMFRVVSRAVYCCSTRRVPTSVLEMRWLQRRV
jgi:hypothetical protein